MTTETRGNGDATAVAIRERDEGGAISAFASEGNFVSAQRMAKALMASSLAPEEYRNNLPNTLIAMELASRIGCSVLMVMQNMRPIKGNPAWASTFLIASVNASGRFTPLRFDFEGTTEEDGDKWGCRAIARDRETGEECRGARVDIRMAKAEGWYSRKDKRGKECSKWQTFPEQMLMYRSATFWTRVYCPEIAMGIRPVDELEDMGYGTPAPSAAAGEVEAALRAAASGEPQTIPGIPVEDENDTGPASAGQLQQLEELREKAREAEAMTVELEEQVEEALKLKDGPGVSAAMKGLNRALLATADAGQGDLGMEG